MLGIVLCDEILDIVDGPKYYVKYPLTSDVQHPTADAGAFTPEKKILQSLSVCRFQDTQP